MNKHTRMAVIIAPFLAIGGWVVSGYYLDSKISAPRLLTLNQEAPCNMLSTPCVLSAKGISFELSHRNAETTVSSSLAVTTIAIAFVDTDGKESAFPLTPNDQQQIWSAPTNYEEIRATSGAETTVRLAATVENLTYIHEFKPGL